MCVCVCVCGGGGSSHTMQQQFPLYLNPVSYTSPAARHQHCYQNANNHIIIDPLRDYPQRHTLGCTETDRDCKQSHTLGRTETDKNYTLRHTLGYTDAQRIYKLRHTLRLTQRLYTLKHVLGLGHTEKQTDKLRNETHTGIY